MSELTPSFERPAALVPYPPPRHEMSDDPGTLELVQGDDRFTIFDPNSIEWYYTGPDRSVRLVDVPGFAGLRLAGTYTEVIDNVLVRLPILVLPYKKIVTPTSPPQQMNEDGTEAWARVVICRGRRYGVHPDHLGQQACGYFVGPQIAQLDLDRMKFHNVPYPGQVLPANNFSDDCVRPDGYDSDHVVVLANPHATPRASREHRQE